MNKTRLFLALVIFIGFLVRFLSVSNNPPSLYWDEASIGYEAFSIAQTGRDMHGNHWLQPIFPAYGDYKAPVYIWLASLAIKVFGPTVMAVRLPSVIFGTLTILTIYLITKLLIKSSRISLLSSLALATLPWHIQFSRAGFEANVALFFVSLLIYFLLKATTRHSFYLNISALSGVIAIYTYFSARIVIPLIILWITLFYASTIKKIIPHLITCIIIFCLGLIPLYRSPHYQAANTIRLSTSNILDNHDGIIYSNQLKSQDHNGVISRALHHRYIYVAKELASNIFAHFEPGYLFFTGDKNLRHSTRITGLMLPTLIIVFGAGLIKLFKNVKMLVFLLGLWAIFLLPASVPRDVPHALRSLNATLPLSIILGIGFNTLFEIFKTSFHKKIVVSVFLVVCTTNLLSYIYYLKHVYPMEAGKDWQDGYRQLSEYVWQEQSKYDYLVVLPEDRLFLYILFFGQFSPEKIQALQQQKNSHQSDRFTVSQIDKITIRPIVWKDDQSGPSNSLLIGLPQDFPESIKKKDVITDQSGQIRYVSVDLSDI